MPSVCRLSLLLVPLCGVLAQPAAPPVFDVASVKVNAGSGEGRGPGRQKITFDPVSLSMTNITLKAAMGWAYHMFPYQVGGPGWLDTERYDIVAKAGSAASEADMRRMLQGLLTERFQVAMHRETKEMAAFVVTVAKGGVKFQESQEAGESDIKPGANMVLNVKRTTMAQLADLIASFPMPYPVVDETGLKGRYDFSVNLVPYVSDASKPQGVEDVIQILIQALHEQLGLKVDQRKTPIEMIVIDHAEKAPTQN
jgi:uncharacterized protein (TIGR03435 family)